MLCQNELFPLCKSRQSIIRAAPEYKRRKAKTVANLKRKFLFAISAPKDLRNTLIKYCTRASHHPVYQQLMELGRSRKNTDCPNNMVKERAIENIIQAMTSRAHVRQMVN